MIIHMTIQKNIKKIQKKEKINIFFLKNNKGPGFCRNLGISKSKSQYVAFLTRMIIGQKIN